MTAPSPPRVGRPPLPQRPLLSVVVPVYQVQAYLEECLDSLVAQTYRDLEVVLVDDGSRDGSVAIAERYAETDTRFTLLHQPNQGIGAARNTGVAASSGQLVTFLDSDDTVPATAYQALVGSLVRTGSDFAVGALARQAKDGAYRQRAWVRRLHQRYRPGVRLEQVPEALANVFAWTKVFRRDFWQDTGLDFPVGTRYEDQVPMTRAYLSAASFDVLPDLVYLWRTRSDGSSITQQKADLADLRDRTAVVSQVQRLVRGRADPALLEAWYGKVFEFDLMAYMRVAPGAGEDYWRLLADHVRPIVDEAPDPAWDRVEARFRLAAWLVARDDRAGLGRLLAFEPLATGNLPVRDGPEGPETALDRLGLPGDAVPRRLTRLRPADLVLRTRLDRAAIAGGTLGLDGVGLVTNVSPAAHRVARTVELERRNRTARLSFPARSVPRPDADVFAAREYEEHAGSAFEATVDLHRVVAASADADPVVWETRLVVAGAGVERAGSFLRRLEHGPVTAPMAAVVDGALVTGSWSEQLGLELGVTRRFAAATAVEAVPAGLLLDLTLPPGATPEALLVRREPVPVTWTATARGGRALVRAADLAGRLGRVAVAVDGNRPVPVRALVEDLDLRGVEVAGAVLDADPALQLRLSPPRPRLVLEEVDLTGSTALLRGRAWQVDAASVLLRGPHAVTAPVALALAKGRFEAEVPLDLPGWDTAVRPLPAGGYAVTARDGDERLKLRASRRLHRRDPAAETAGWTAEVSQARALTLRRLALGPQDRSALAQRRLREHRYEPARTGPRSRSVLFETCSDGLTWTDAGPVATCLARRAPELDLLWGCADDAAVPPPGTRPVLHGGAEWHTALGAARALVTDGPLPGFLRPPAGQVVVRLGGGTPLRRLDPAAEPRRLDLVVSAGPACTRALHADLGGLLRDAVVVETGQPRHDALAAAGRAATRAATRRALGVEAGQRLLLYAPTTRETVRAHTRREKVSHLDVDRLMEVPDLVVAHRAHPTSVHQPELRRGARFHDVTRVPDLAALVLAADLLVTDLSSVLADFVLTDAPVLLLVPDLPSFASRGLHAGLAEPPGPVLATTEELVAALAEDPRRWREPRARARAELAPLADGHATDRVVDELVERLR